jgi:hypothetical protein
MNNKRRYLIFDDVKKDSSHKPVFDAAVKMVLDNTARISNTRTEPGDMQWPCFRVDDAEIIDRSLLEYYLYELTVNGFDYKKARDFSERMIKHCGFHNSMISYTLEEWVYTYLRKPYFKNEAKGSKGKDYPKWVLKPNKKHHLIPEDYFAFACYVAVSCVKHGPSYASLVADEIFWFVSELGSNLPAHMKKYGSGDIPKETLEHKDATFSFKANDVFATIRIVIKEESEANYEKTLEYLCSLLSSGFPRSYTIDFRSPEKNYLAIKGLPKKGVHQMFANAVQYAALHNKIERYARLAMKEYEWYTNLENEYCAMPGTFAVFSLGLLGESYHTLTKEYLALCDGEHQSVQGKFVLAYIKKYGWTDKGMELYNLCKDNIQHMPKNLMM